MTRDATSTSALVFAYWPWALAAAVIVAVVAGLCYLIYRSPRRERTAAIVGISLVWFLGVSAAVAQLFPGIGQRLPLPVTLEGQRSVRSVTIEQAKRAAAFPVFTPAYLPGRLTLEETRIHHAGRSTGVVVIQTYYDSRSNTQMEIWQTEAAGTTVEPGQANERVMGQFARVSSSGGTTSIEWVVGTTRIEISGDLNRREAVKVAQSMR